MYAKMDHGAILAKQLTAESVWGKCVDADKGVRILDGEKRRIHRWTGDACPTGACWKHVPDAEEMDVAFRWLPEAKQSPRAAKSCVETTAITGRKFRDVDRQDESIVLPLLNGYIRVIVEGKRLPGKREGRRARFEWSAPDREAEKTYTVPVSIDQPHGTPYVPREDLRGTRFWDDYLTKSLDADEAAYLQSFFGYTLLEHNNEQQGLFMHGNGGEGKSTLVNLCGRMHRRIVPVSMRKLGDFGLSTATAASLIFVDDAPATWDTADVMKSVLSAGLMSMDVKFATANEGRIFAKMVVCGNEVPYVNDASNGWQRRWMLAKWSRTVVKDAYLETHIARNELWAVLDWMLLGLKRYLERGLPTMDEAPASSRMLFEELVSANNTAAAWAIYAGATVDPGIRTEKKAIFDHYRAWGFDMDKNPKSMKDNPRFFIAQKQHLGHFEESRSGGRQGQGQQRVVGIRVPGIPWSAVPDKADIIHLDPKRLEGAGSILAVLDEAMRRPS